MVRLSTSQTFVHAPPQPALLWLQQWFQPARAKLLFSRADVAELTDLTEKAVTKLAAVCRIPVSYEPALGGLVFSAWAVKRLLMAEASGGVAAVETDSQRFDRQALLWMLLERDPKRALAPPSFDEALEQELSRVAALPEPARTLRSMALWEQWQDARLLADTISRGDLARSSSPDASGADLSFSRSRPARRASASSETLNAQRVSRIERKFSSLHEF